MANTVTSLSYANTFGDWLIATNALIVENNASANGNYTKPYGTLFLQDPTLGLQVTANAVIGRQLRVEGTGSDAFIQNNLRVTGQVLLTNTTSTITANGPVTLAGSGNGLVVANNALVSGDLNVSYNVGSLTSSASVATVATRLNANGATGYFTNIVTSGLTATSLTATSLTVGGSTLATQAFAQAGFDKANSAGTVAQAGFDAANTVSSNLSANVTYLTGVNTAQNTRIQLVFNTANVGSSFVSGGGNVSGTILPSANVTYDLGSSSNVWSNVHTRNIIQYSPLNEVPSANISQILVVGDDGRTVRKANAAAITTALSVSAIPTMIVITTVGTTNWVVPAGVTKIRVTVAGGGGGGGGAGTVACLGPAAGGGGAGGGTAIKVISGLVPGNTISVTVGAGGSQGSYSFSSYGGNGGGGGTSSFGSYCSATGGAGGIGGGQNNYAIYNVTSPVGGQGVSGDLNLQGGSPHNPNDSPLISVYSSFPGYPGGASYLGQTSAVRAPYGYSVNGSVPGLPYGGGGQGGGYDNYYGYPNYGALGGQGVVIIEY